MKFKYKRFSPAFIRPIIPIKIGYGGVTVEQGVLVDSGADICLFDARIGKLIGVPVEQGEPRVFRGLQPLHRRIICIQSQLMWGDGNIK
jgi:hypothetical protein